MSIVEDKVKQFANWTGETIGALTGSDQVEEQAKKEGAKMDKLAAEAKAMAAEQAGNLQEAESIRSGLISTGYADAKQQLQPWRGVGDASRGAYEENVMRSPTQFGTEAGTQMMGQALAGQGDVDPRLAGYQQSAMNPALTQGADQSALRQAGAQAQQGISSDLSGQLDIQAGQQQGLSPELMQQAATTPQSQYFDQAAQTAMARPSRLEDIEGYGLMQQARDEALQSSAQGFAGQGKMFSGSRMKEAGNIGAREAQNLIQQDNQQRQQQVQNLMGLGAQDVSMTQQGFQNQMGAQAQDFGMGQQGFQNLAGREQVGLGTQQQNIQNQLTGGQVIAGANQQDFQNQVGVQSMQDQRDQQNFQNLMGIQGMQDQRGQQGFQNLAAANQMGLGTQQMDYGARQTQMGQQRDLMGFGYGVDRDVGNLAVQQGQQLGASGYGSAQDQANLLMGGQAGSAALSQAGSGLRMEGASSRQDMFGDAFQGLAGLAGAAYGGGGFSMGGGGGINYGGGYSNDNYLV